MKTPFRISLIPRSTHDTMNRHPKNQRKNQRRHSHPGVLLLFVVGFIGLGGIQGNAESLPSGLILRNPAHNASEAETRQASTGGPSPVRAAWNEAQKQMAGNPRVEVVRETPERLEVRITRNGQKIPYVFLLDRKTERKAEVTAGVVDAGVDTIYHLQKKGELWVVIRVEEVEF